MSRKSGAPRATAMALAGLAVAVPALAATATPLPAAIEQVTVTALRQQTDLQKAPAAITPIPAAALDASAITTIAGLNGFVPGVNITKAAGFENLVNIRGVGSATPENSATTQPGVALFVDGVYLANSIALNESLFDIARIEVLRGPQGTLYAQSSTGGVISLVTNQPVLGQFTGTAEASFGNDALFRERIALNVPVTDQIAVRAAVQKYDHDGFAHETDGYDLDDQHEYSGKIAVLYKPDADFTATLTARQYQSNEHGAEQKNILDPAPDPRVVDQDFPSKFTLHTQLIHLNMAYQLPFATLESVTGYQNLNNDQSFDSGRLSTTLSKTYDLVPVYDTREQNYTEDLDIRALPGAPIDYIAGVFAEKIRTTQFVAEFDGGDVTNPDIAVLPDIVTNSPGNLKFGNVVAVNRVSVAPYAQLTWHVLPNLRLIGGARFNYDRYNAFSQTFSAFGGGSLNTIDSTKRVTGNAAIQYDATPTTMLYASVTEGYKPGGINGNPGAAVVSHIFAPEDITAFELGTKNDFLDHHLRLNTAGFFYDYRHMQYIEVDPVPFAYGIANVPDTHIYGAEAEASYLTFNDRLRLNANIAVDSGKLNGDYKAIDQSEASAILDNSAICPSHGFQSDPSCEQAIIANAKTVNGNKPPQLPLFQTAINAAYTLDILRTTSLAGTLVSRAEFIYRTSEYARIFNDPILDKIPGYGIVNLNFHYAREDGHTTLDLALTNIANRNGIASRYTDPYGTATTSQTYIPPRQVIGTIGYAF